MMVKPSLIILDLGADHRELFFFPAYEVHVAMLFSFGRYYGLASIGFKHFLRKARVTHEGQSVLYPEFRFTDSSKPRQWLPATDLAIGVRF